MKKFVFLLVLLFIVLFNFSTKAYTAKKIDLKIKDDETTIVFLRLENSNSLLINDEDDSNLFIIDYENDKKLKETVKIFGSNPDVFYLNKSIDKVVDNVHVFKQNPILRFRINNYTLCVYKDKQSINDCDFVYIISLDKEFEINENLLAIFYDYDIDKKWLKNVGESWIDNSIVSTDGFTILKLNEDSYNILIVPSTNN